MHGVIEIFRTYVNLGIGSTVKDGHSITVKMGDWHSFSFISLYGDVWLDLKMHERELLGIILHYLHHLNGFDCSRCGAPHAIRMPIVKIVVILAKPSCHSTCEAQLGSAPLCHTCWKDYLRAVETLNNFLEVPHE